jgi:hypothetical protein
MSPLVHIAPQLPPAIDGVGDYCWNLWKHWPEAEPDWKFLVARGADETAAVWRAIEVRAFTLNKSSFAAALEQSGCENAVLHYVSYGFQPKGIPIWLPGAITEWKQANPRRRLVTMFHEMYARSSPLRSPFWVAPLARRIIREIIGLSDAWITSCDRYFNQLTREFKAQAELGCIIPIGSNIPLVSPLDPKWAADSAPLSRFRFAVFGLAKTRLWALERHWKLLHALREAGAVESITLLGKHNETDDDTAEQRFINAIGATEWRRQFDLSAVELSQELAGQDFGFLANEPDILTKSGVFAALATHGVIPIIPIAQAARPEFVNQAALSNDDTPQSFAALLDTLRDAAKLRSRRERLLAVATDHLAWPRVTQRWHAAVNSALSQRLTRSKGVNVPILTPA